MPIFRYFGTYPRSDGVILTNSWSLTGPVLDGLRQCAAARRLIFCYGPAEVLQPVRTSLYADDGGMEDICKAFDLCCSYLGIEPKNTQAYVSHSASGNYGIVNVKQFWEWVHPQVGPKLPPPKAKTKQFECDYQTIKEYTDGDFIRTYIESTPPLASVEEIWRATMLAAGCVK